MEPDNSTEKAETGPQKKKSNQRLPSPEYLALVARLRYIGDFIFGGDTKAYAAAIGASEAWLKNILRSNRRFRIVGFTKFVTSGLVSAEWLFCGTGPMLKKNVSTDTFSNLNYMHAINSRYALLDTLTLAPFSVTTPPFVNTKPVEEINDTARKTVSIARQIFISTKNDRPVILFLNAPPLLADITPIVADMIAKKYITGLALTLAAAEIDYQRAGHTDLNAFNDVVIRAAADGTGLGEALGSFLSHGESGAKSLLAAAYVLGIPISIHGSIGESPLHFCPAKSGAELGAAYGATGYIDSLVFAEQVRQMAGDKMSLFLNVGPVAPGLPLFSSAMAAAQEGLGLSFNRVKISRITSRKVDSNLDTCVCGPYDKVLTLVAGGCDALFAGGFDVYTNTGTGEQFAAFAMLNECAERVRKSAKTNSKRKR